MFHVNLLFNSRSVALATCGMNESLCLPCSREKAITISLLYQTNCIFQTKERQSPTLEDIEVCHRV